MIRYVIYSKELGIYLGSSMGMGFWSNLDPAGQKYAIAFPAEDLTLIQDFVKAWDDPVVDIEFKAVKTDRTDGYVSMTDCVEAGLPGWDRRS